MPHTVHISALIHAPLARVWPLFRDFNGLAGWHPGIAQSRLEAGGRHDAVGSVRYLTLKPSGFVREQLLMLDDPGTALRYSIIETDLPMRDYIAGVTLRPVTEGGATQVEWWADFRVEDGADLQAVASAVGQGVFAAGLAALAAQRVMEPDLAYALLARPTVVRAMCIIRHKEYPLSPAAEALILAIHAYLRGAALPAGCKLAAGAGRKRG